MWWIRSRWKTLMLDCYVTQHLLYMESTLFKCQRERRKRYQRVWSLWRYWKILLIEFWCHVQHSRVSYNLISCISSVTVLGINHLLKHNKAYFCVKIYFIKLHNLRSILLLVFYLSDFLEVPFFSQSSQFGRILIIWPLF